MSWSRTYTRTSEPEPYDSVLFCGICGVEVHVTRWDLKKTVDEWSEELLTAWVASSEENARRHLETCHRFRLWLWERLGWRWLIGGLAP